METPPVTFFYPSPQQDIEQLKALDVDNNWAFLSRVWSNEWTLQTYLWLRKKGYAVDLSEDVPKAGIVVVGPGTGMARKFIGRYKTARREVAVVTICADSARSFISDVDVMQNGYYADEKRTFFIPFWPQPGLLPRHAARGHTLEHVVYKGAAGNLHPDFSSPAWRQFLQGRGLTWVVEDTPAGTAACSTGWHDYTHVDVILAARPQFGKPYYNKPASKLINAWHAGVPALLGPEFPFRELRRSERDYIEIASVEDAMVGIQRLIDHPEWYLQMVENGKRRARAFTHDRITELWADVLFEQVPRWMADQRTYLRLPIGIRRMVNIVRNPPHGWELRAYAGKMVRGLRKKFNA
jgi:hypothetical protein